MGREFTNGRRDAAIARVAARQHGVVSAEQLDSVGMRDKGRTLRVQAARLHRIHRGVYAVGHPGLSEGGTWMAAVLACGPSAVLSHTSAARLWRILPAPRRDEVRLPARGEAPTVHVTVRGEGRDRPGIRVHRSRILRPGEITRLDNIPVTRPGRTLRDLRRLLPQPQFDAALRKAEFLKLPLGPRSTPTAPVASWRRSSWASCAATAFPGQR